MAARLNRRVASLPLGLLNLALAMRYRRMFRRMAAAGMKAPNIAAPRTFAEKVHWRKVFDNDPRFAVLLDKLKAREAVRSRLPWLAMPELLWEGDDAAKIPFDSLRVPYIVKCNHGCAMNIAVPDPAQADRASIVGTMTRHLAKVYGVAALERAYAGIAPRVFVEALIGKDDGYVPVDYKFSTIGGRVAYVVVTADRSTNRTVAFYDREWHRLPLVQRGIASTLELERPESFSRMVEAAETLGTGFDMLRVDLYEERGAPMFGEFTVYPRSGLLRFDPPAFDQALGEHWNLGASAYLSHPPGLFARVYRWLLAAGGHLRD